MFKSLSNRYMYEGVDKHIYMCCSQGDGSNTSVSRLSYLVLDTVLQLSSCTLTVYGTMCVFFPSILDIKFVGRTSRGHTGGRSHRIFNPPSFCGACLDFCREKDSAIPFPRRP